MDKKKYLYIGIAAIVALALCFIIGYRTGYNKADAPDVVIHTDTVTVVVRDTVTQEKPVYVKERIVDTMYLSITDTLRIRDSVFVAVERTQREYSDSLYHAWVSGYDPALDSIQVFSSTKIQYVTTTVHKPPKHWHIGVSGGYGAALHDKHVILSPYIGVGITYSIISF